MSTFRLSLRALSHPLSLAAIGLLLLNDHVLKAAAPSWLTGKLSDFAGLFFFPFVFIAILTIPFVGGPLRHRTPAWMPALAFGVTAIWFAAIKILPAANAVMAQVVGWFAGGPVFIAPDATDVMALVSLVPACLLWRRVVQTATDDDQRGLPAKSQAPALDWKGLAALTLAAVATIATSPATCAELPRVKQVTVVDGQVYIGTKYPYSTKPQYVTTEGYRIYTVPIGTYPGLIDALHKTITYPHIACDPTNQQQCYRIGPPDQVEESSDHGATWQISWRVPEARRTYIERYANASSCWGPASLDAGPYDLAFVEHADGMEVVVAMGGQGLLVRTGDGVWHRREVIGARPIPWEAGGENLILPETLISLIGACLAQLTLAAIAARPWTKPWRWAVVAVINGVGIGMILWPTVFPSDFSLVALINFLLGWPVLLVGILLGLAQIAAAFGAGRAWQSLGLVSLVTAVSYSSFYAWTEGYIARYEVAAGAAVVASLAILWLSARSTRHWQKLTSASN